MTVLSDQPSLAKSIHIAPDERTASVTVRWEISRAAFFAARPDLARAAASGAPILLEWCIERRADGEIVAHASLFDPPWNRRTPLLSTTSALFRSDSGPIWIEDASMLHVDIPGLLMLSLRLNRDHQTLLYARTTLLSELGVPGGRYEAPMLAGDSDS